MSEQVFFQFSTSTVLLLLIGFYGLTFLLSTVVSKNANNVDGYMVSSGAVGFGISAASMTATWIWAASFYGAATSGYKYGLSGPMLWQKLCTRDTARPASLFWQFPIYWVVLLV